MAVTLPGTGLPVATDFINPDHHQLMKMEFGAAGTATPVSAANPLPVVFATAPTTPVTGTFWQATQPVSFTWAGLTDTQLRATALPVSGTFFQATQPVSIAASVVVTNAGTFATQTTLAAETTKVIGTVNNAAGANIIGKVGIDQTTPGTTNAVVVTTNGVVSTANSSSSALGIGAVFTGTSEDVTEFADLRVSVFSDQVSATDGLQIQQSSNGTNWDVLDSYTIPASNGKTFSVGVSARFARVVYTNGGVAQTAFRLQTKFHKTYSKGSSVRPQDGRTNDNDYEEMLTHLMGYNGTTWDRLRSTIANGLQVDVTRSAPDVTASGSLVTAAQVVTLPLTGQSAAAAQITGTWVGTITFEASLDGATWNPINAVSASTSTPQTTTTVNGLYRITPAGVQQIRANMSAFTSGSATVLLRASMGAGGTFANQILPIKNTDGVSVQTLKAASTAAAFTDQAAVVDIRPGGVLAGMGAVATTGDTGAKIITGNGATVANSGNKGVQIVIVLGVVTGVTPTAVFKVQTSVDGGTTWVDLPGATTASLVATGVWGITIYPGQAVTAGTTVSGTTATVSGVIPRSWRVVWTIGGTTPSFTITSITYNYLPN